MNSDAIEARLNAARLGERERIARDVHDALGGDLAAVKMAFAVLARHLPQDPRLQEEAAYVDKLIDGAIDSMHKLAEKSLGTSVGTLAQIIALQVDAFRRQSGLDCQCTLEDVSLNPQRGAGEAICRILRECLVNIGKHAKADHVHVELHSSDGHLTLSVRDDGIGIDIDAARPDARAGMGLRIMRERAAEAGGTLSIRAAAPRGTLVTVELPLHGQPSSDTIAGAP